MGIYRSIHFKVDIRSWKSNPCPHSLSILNGRQGWVNLPAVLTYTALCTMPPTGYGFELAYAWPWLRYLSAFESNTDLRLREEWQQLDPHQKTILSDEIGMGLTSLVVCNRLQLDSIPLPTKWVIEFVRNKFKKPWIFLPRHYKRGQSKCPDFVGICLSPNQAIHIWECKGTQVYSNLKKQIQYGISQKNTPIVAQNLCGERLAIGLYIPGSRTRKMAECRIADPPINLGPEQEFSFNEVLELMVYGELAIGMQLLGLTRIGNSLAMINETRNVTHLSRFERLYIEKQFDTFGSQILRQEIFGIRREVWYATPLPLDGNSKHNIVGMRFTVGIDHHLFDFLQSHNFFNFIEVIKERVKHRLKHWEHIETTPSLLLEKPDQELEEKNLALYERVTHSGFCLQTELLID